MHIAKKQHADHEVAQLEHLRYTSLLAGDWSAFELLCHRDFIYTHTSGEVDTAGSYCAKLRAGHYVFRSFDYPIERMWADVRTCLIWSHVRAEMIAGGVTKTLDNLVLTVWMREADLWRLLAQHPLPRTPRYM